MLSLGYSSTVQSLPISCFDKVLNWISLFRWWLSSRNSLLLHGVERLCKKHQTDTALHIHQRCTSSFHLPSAGELKVGNGYIAPRIYVITSFGPHRKSVATQDFRPRGVEPMTIIEYNMNLAYIVSYIFSSRLIPYWGQSFFKKLFFRKTDCCNIAVSSTGRRTGVALEKELRRL